MQSVFWGKTQLTRCKDCKLFLPSQLQQWSEPFGTRFCNHWEGFDWSDPVVLTVFWPVCLPVATLGCIEGRLDYQPQERDKTIANFIFFRTLRTCSCCFQVETDDFGLILRFFYISHQEFVLLNEHVTMYLGFYHCSSSREERLHRSLFFLSVLWVHDISGISTFLGFIELYIKEWNSVNEENFHFSLKVW